ncbi:MAG: hypothetical protein HYX97_03920, partial [Chloroflexi bacterium]|nr:hypothetical protein [Chloroflexota bacterium]
MLIGLDDTLHHQLPIAFGDVGPSDHRFYDRYLFALFANNGEVMVAATMGVYKNMNVLDGGVSIVDTAAARQYNVRVSRQLRPDMDSMGAGPLRCELVEPLKRHRLTLGENDYGVSFELEFEALAPPHEEAHYYHRRDGRVLMDIHRFDQVGRVSGWVKVGKKTYRATKETWMSARDHSWGIRRRTGGSEPVTSEQPPPKSGLFNWSVYQLGDYSCYFQVTEGGAGGHRHPLDGSIHIVSGDRPRQLRITHVQHQVECYAGSRRIKQGTYVLTDEEGRKRQITVTRLKDPFGYVVPGYGYGGFHDGKGLGVYRGRLLVEGEARDVSDFATVRDLQGNPLDLPRETEGWPVRVE